MKTLLKIIAILLIIGMSVGLLSCSAAFGSMMGDGVRVDYSPMEPEPEEPDDETGEDEENKEENNVVLPSGMITAGAWNDNANYEMWISLFSQADKENDLEEGKFFIYSADKGWGFNSLKRVKVNVSFEGSPVAGATVVAYDEDENVTFSAVSDAQGNAYLFVRDDNGSVIVESGEASASATFDRENRELSVELDGCGEKLNVIEIMLVVDVTGSMGDEISFLKAELADVINKIAAYDENTVIKLAFLFYRDIDDKVPFDYDEFMNVSDSIGLALRQAELDKQYASGGGDYEEAVDEALEMAVNAQWSTGATTKLIFHFLDAPAHSGKQYEERFNNAVMTAAQKGIRICPVLCSGAAEVTEYTMRQAAVYTGGTFIFVTDDSGIGNSHYDPNLPNVTVELLNSMLVRLVKGYHTGEFDEPIFWKDDPALATQK